MMERCGAAAGEITIEKGKEKSAGSWYFWILCLCLSSRQQNGTTPQLLFGGETTMRGD